MAVWMAAQRAVCSCALGWLCKGWPAACLELVDWLEGWLVGSRAAQWSCVSVCRVGWPGADWVAGCWIKGLLRQGGLEGWLVGCLWGRQC